MTATAVQLTALITPTEAEFTSQVVTLAHTYGWLVAHFAPARRADGTWRTPVRADGAGLPDLILCRPPRRVIYAELKTDKGRVEPLQERWLAALSACDGVESFVWRPRDWDTICAVLA